MKKATTYEGIQAYDGNCLYQRGKSITIRYAGKANPSETDEPEQVMHIDNEDVHYKEMIKFDCLESLKQCKVDILIDTDTYFTEFNAFILNHNQMINPKDFKEGQLQRIVCKLESYQDHPDVLEKQVEAYFIEFDEDESGALDRNELKNFLMAFFLQYKIRVPLTEEFVDTTFDDIDADGDGAVDL